MNYAIVRRTPVEDHHLSHIHSPLLRQIYAQRGLQPEAYPLALKHLLKPEQLHQSAHAAQLIAQAILQQKRIMIMGDFDVDGATSTTIMLLALKALGAEHMDFLIPNRFEFGYGLSPELVDVAHQRKAELLVTVDNGISSHEGVARAHTYGMQVVITDHHLPGQTLPDADAIVNPNQASCSFPSKAIAGCGVAFYMACAVKQALIERRFITLEEAPNFSDLLDLVALGTVADVVALDTNNRILVQAGLHRIRQGRCRPGITALLSLAKRDPLHLVAADLGFGVAPRINAAGRLEDMSLGVELLLCDSYEAAYPLALHLHELNLERRQLEQEMQQAAEAELCALEIDESCMPLGLVLYQASWHQGVIGILASRLKEKYHRPVFAFAKTSEQEIKGSVRSIAGLHIRDVLAEVHQHHPDIMIGFGGHAMAAGLTLHLDQLERFKSAVLEVLSEHLNAHVLQGVYRSDGALPASELTLETALMLEQAGPWGQGFEEPLFDDTFIILRQTPVGEKHMRLELMTLCQTRRVTAMLFHIDQQLWPHQVQSRVSVVYRLQVNRFRQQQNVQMIIVQVTS